MHVEGRSRGNESRLISATHQQWDEIELEGDYVLVLHAINNESEDLSEVGLITSDFMLYLHAFDFCLLDMFIGKQSCCA